MSLSRTLRPKHDPHFLSSLLAWGRVSVDKPMRLIGIQRS